MPGSSVQQLPEELPRSVLKLKLRVKGRLQLEHTICKIQGKLGLLALLQEIKYPAKQTLIKSNNGFVQLENSAFPNTQLALFNFDQTFLDLDQK